jgi:predicted PurR-regulated permease PerM
MMLESSGQPASALRAAVARVDDAGEAAMTPRALRQGKSSDEIVQLALRLGLLIFLVYWSFVLVRPFIPVLAWSIILTVALYPAFDWLAQNLGGRPKLAATLITLVNLAIIIGPVAWLGLGMVEGVQHLAGLLGAGTLAIPSPPQAIKDWPLVGPQLYGLWEQASSNMAAALRALTPYLKPLAGPMLAVAGSTGIGALKFVLSVAISGVLFLYGPGLVAASRRIQARLVTQRSEDFVGLAGLTIRTVSQGVIGVAVLQALLAGVGLKLAGVGHAGLLAFAVLILAILQIGAAIVLFPVLIWIWATKEFGVALLLTIYLLIVGLADNVLKPMLMGRGLNTPMLVIFIGVLGGMIAHGMVGLFIGPIILAVVWQLAMAWMGEEPATVIVPDPEPAGTTIAAES